MQELSSAFNSVLLPNPSLRIRIVQHRELPIEADCRRLRASERHEYPPTVSGPLVMPDCVLVLAIPHVRVFDTDAKLI